jgi:hypothetical protein
LTDDPRTFFGDPNLSPVDATVKVLSSVFEHRFPGRVALRNRLSCGDYDKFYQNVFPGGTTNDGAAAVINAYNNATDRRNLFNQTDVIFTPRAGRHPAHRARRRRARPTGDRQLPLDGLLHVDRPVGDVGGRAD